MFILSQDKKIVEEVKSVRVERLPQAHAPNRDVYKRQVHRYERKADTEDDYWGRPDSGGGEYLYLHSVRVPGRIRRLSPDGKPGRQLHGLSIPSDVLSDLRGGGSSGAVRHCLLYDTQIPKGKSDGTAAGSIELLGAVVLRPGGKAGGRTFRLYRYSCSRGRGRMSRWGQT